MGVTRPMDVLPRATTYDNVPNQQVPLYVSQFVTFAVATICICLRFFSRRLTRVPLWWDDYLVVVAYVMGTGFMIIIVLWIQEGLGIHIDDFARITGQPVDRILYMNKLLLYFGELFYALSLFFGKISVLCFYWRMFKVTNIKLPIQILGGCAIVWITIRTFISIFHCVPVQAFWDSSAGGYCAIDDRKFFFGTLLVHLVMDLCIMSLPIVQIKKLQLPIMQKMGVLAMFMFGIFICAAALVVVVSSLQFDAASPDITWNITTIIVWASAECNLVTISACMPVLRPALKFLINCEATSQLGSGSNSTPYGGSNSYALSQTGKTKRLQSLHNKEADESASTYELANSINQSNEGDFDSHALDGPHQTRVVIQGRDREAAGKAGSPASSPVGITVHSETTVTSSRYPSSRNKEG